MGSAMQITLMQETSEKHSLSKLPDASSVPELLKPREATYGTARM